MSKRRKRSRANEQPASEQEAGDEFSPLGSAGELPTETPPGEDPAESEPNDLQSDETASAESQEAAAEVDLFLDDLSSATDLDPSLRTAAGKVRGFPRTPGVYLMKDSAGRVIYVGKAKNLRARAGSYFLKAAAVDRRTSDLVREIADIDYIDAESEVDALLAEARLIKDVRPKYNVDLKDDKSFPYLEIYTREEFPRVEFTREPHERGTKLYGPFANAGSLRAAIQVLQKIFKFRTCSLDISSDEPKWQWFRPCLLASIDQCTAPCNLRISKEDYRRDIKRLRLFLEGKKSALLAEMKFEMNEAAQSLRFEAAARLRDEIRMLETLDKRGELDTHVQPEVFYVDPKRGLAGLKKILRLDQTPRTIEGVDIAHLGGGETVASLVQFIDGLPFKPGYKRFRIRTQGKIDDYASIHEVVARRFRRLESEGSVFPDILLVDGGKGQLGAALSAFTTLNITPPVVLSLAKREEEIYLSGAEEPLRLSRHAYALRLLQYVRDEAHRFAQHYHHILRRRKTLGE